MCGLLAAINWHPAAWSGLSGGLDLLASGMTADEIRVDYPQLAAADILAAIAYGAEAARERIIPVPQALGPTLPQT